MLPKLYNSHGYQLLWIDSTHRANAIKVIRGASDDGLEPNDYHLKSIDELIRQHSDDYEINASIDILITDGIILYGTHLLNGKTDPQTLEPTLLYEQRVLSDEVLNEMRSHLIDGEVQKIVSDLRPKAPYYKEMMKGLARYQAIADSGGWRSIALKVRKIEPGDTINVISSIRKRLALEGDYALDVDSLLADSTFPFDRYDKTLQGAVKLFQKRHGLNDDAIIGRSTINIFAREKVDLLKTNLDRARWLYHDLADEYILVNIAGYDLRMVRDAELLWKTRVVSGKTTSATPVFKDEIEYIDLNPVWALPFSIADGEILPKLKKDSTYLKRNNMELLTGSGKSIDPSTVNFKKIKARNFPYFIRQGPGPGNSLGRVKFLFPNQHSVYLHDTPSRSLFVREDRAFSHGCIRVEDPLTLAELILVKEDVSRIEIDSIITTNETQRYVLKEALPVMITYATAFAENDIVYFYKDVYKRDAELMSALGLRP
jgi:murein L,D-transpeptidase YcbB/YkuD